MQSPVLFSSLKRYPLIEGKNKNKRSEKKNKRLKASSDWEQKNVRQATRMLDKQQAAKMEIA